MKKKNLILGIILILLGFVWILSNLNVINIDLYNIFTLVVRGMFDLWPLVLVIAGVGIIFKNDLINTVLWVLLLVLVIVYSLFIKGNILEKDSNGFEDEVYISEMSNDIKEGSLNIDVGATTFSIDSTNDKFVKLDQDGTFEYKFSNKESVENLYISNKKNYLMSRNSGKFDLLLNSDIQWDLDFDIGAVTGNLNLKDIKVRRVDLDMGAGDIEITLGEKNRITSLDLDAGASKILINIPKDVGLKLEFDGGLNSTNIAALGLVKVDDGEFISENYEDAITKYEIDVDMGVGSFEINYY
jgi:hypothetical protein